MQPDCNPYDIPNGVDRLAEAALRDRHRGEAGMVLCGSPGLDADLAGCADMPGPRIGVNLTALSHDTTYCLNAGDEKFLALVNPRVCAKIAFVLPSCDAVLAWLRLHDWPENVTLYTSPPVLPPGVPEISRALPRPYQGGNLSGPAALWLAWYMGMNPIRLCGCHCRLSPAGEYYAVQGMLERLLPAEADRQAYLARARQLLPEFARIMLALVEVMRDSGVTIHWPGEIDARGSAQQEVLA